MSRTLWSPLNTDNAKKAPHIAPIYMFLFEKNSGLGEVDLHTGSNTLSPAMH